MCPDGGSRCRAGSSRTPRGCESGWSPGRGVVVPLVGLVDLARSKAFVPEDPRAPTSLTDEFLEARMATQRIPGWIDAEPGRSQPPGDRKQVFQAADRGVGLPDHRVDASQVVLMAVPSKRLLRDWQKVDRFLPCCDRLILSAEACRGDPQRAMQPRIVGMLPKLPSHDIARR